MGWVGVTGPSLQQGERTERRSDGSNLWPIVYGLWLRLSLSLFIFIAYCWVGFNPNSSPKKGLSRVIKVVARQAGFKLNAMTERKRSRDPFSCSTSNCGSPEKEEIETMLVCW